MRFGSFLRLGTQRRAIAESAVLDLEPDASRALLELERSVADMSAFAVVAAQLHVVASP